MLELLEILTAQAPNVGTLSASALSTSCLLPVVVESVHATGQLGVFMR